MNVVYECSHDVYEKTGIEHICEDCLKSSDDLILISNGTYYNLVEFKKEEECNK